MVGARPRSGVRRGHRRPAHRAPRQRGPGRRRSRAWGSLEGQWSRGEDVGTEELRVALQRYRAFFRRLLSA